MSATVFISYSHRDRDLLDPLVAQLKALEQAGLLEVWADTRIDAGEKWYPEIEAAMQQAALAVCLVSEYFLASDFCAKEEVPFLLKRQAKGGLLILPVLLSDCPWYAHRWVEERQMLPGEGRSVRTHFAQNPAAVFSRVAKTIFERLNDPNYRPPTRPPAWLPLSPVNIDLTRLPETGAALFGRAQELALYDEAWVSAEKADSARTRILAFTAHGGVGKSTLVNHWLADMKRDHFRGATRVFGWSFYSQGARDQMASADAFIAAALKFFGDAAMAESAGSPWDKGERLARLVGDERTLIVLDGMEPLQSAHSFERGKLRDPALEAFLRGLARRSAGLCLITTREPVPDLDGLPGVMARDLEQIAPEAGRALLRTRRVVGTDAELEALAARFGPHALAISLLGVYLYENDPAHGTSLAQRLDALVGERPIDRVLAAFEHWLAGGPELEALRLLGFFDRPADAGCLGALRAQPAIPGLTEQISDLVDAGWERVIARLQSLKLVQKQECRGAFVLDAHPLLREHFGRQLRELHVDAWREGHRRLCEHLTASTPHCPEGLAGLQPLYHAIAHGARAGLHRQIYLDIYVERINRGSAAYSTLQLGAFGADLAALACFFKEPWNLIVPVLTDGEQAEVLHSAAFNLRALGRLNEALEPSRQALKLMVRLENWEWAAVESLNASEGEFTVGELGEAIERAEEAVSFATRCDDAYLRLCTWAMLGEALVQAGKEASARDAFRQAEEFHRQLNPEVRLFCSWPGYFQCGLLLAPAERMAWRIQLGSDDIGAGSNTCAMVALCREIEGGVPLAAIAVAWEKDRPLNLAVDHLSIGRAVFYRGLLESARGTLAVARRELTSAVEGLRAAGDMSYLPRPLLARAWLRCIERDLEGARVDLNEAYEIAERGSMKLHLADVLLHRARLFRDKAELENARKLITECGYWRRKEELADAEEASKSW